MAGLTARKWFQEVCFTLQSVEEREAQSRRVVTLGKDRNIKFERFQHFVSTTYNH